MGGWRKTPIALLIISAIDVQGVHSHECVDLDISICVSGSYKRVHSHECVDLDVVD